MGVCLWFCMLDKQIGDLRGYVLTRIEGHLRDGFVRLARTFAVLIQFIFIYTFR